MSRSSPDFPTESSTIILSRLQAPPSNARSHPNKAHPKKNEPFVTAGFLTESPTVVLSGLVRVYLRGWESEAELYLRDERTTEKTIGMCRLHFWDRVCWPRAVKGSHHTCEAPIGCGGWGVGCWHGKGWAGMWNVHGGG